MDIGSAERTSSLDITTLKKPDGEDVHPGAKYRNEGTMVCLQMALPPPHASFLVLPQRHSNQQRHAQWGTRTQITKQIGLWINTHRRSNASAHVKELAAVPRRALIRVVNAFFLSSTS
jgi:hypothetical protein